METICSILNCQESTEPSGMDNLETDRHIATSIGNHTTVIPYNTELTIRTSSSSSSSSAAPWDHRYVVRMLWVFGGPIIFFVGICGNSLVVAVMSQRRMRGSSTSVYLSLMAIADTMVLLTGIPPEWLEATKIIILKEWHQVTCKLEKFLFYTSADTAVWFLVIFTIDRFIAVCYPLKKSNFCRSSRAKLSCAIVLIVAILKNVHVLGTRGSQYRVDANQTTSELVSNCGKPSSASEYFEDFVRPWIAFVIVSVLPFCLILLCNAFIVGALLRVRRLRTEHSITSTSDRSLIQMTAMCLSASFCFLICVTPSIILLIGKPYWRNNPASAAGYEIAKVINNELVFVNHSINFFLYCITGRRFRTAIWPALRCHHHSTADNMTLTADATFESRTTLARMASSSPEGGRGRRSSCAATPTGGSLTNGRHVINRSASLGIANVVFKKTVSDLNAAPPQAAALTKSRTVIQSFESVI